jgi:hypothetical protein
MMLDCSRIAWYSRLTRVHELCPHVNFCILLLSVLILDSVDIGKVSRGVVIPEILVTDNRSSVGLVRCLFIK